MIERLIYVALIYSFESAITVGQDMDRNEVESSSVGPHNHGVIDKQRGHLYAKVYVNKAKLRVALSPALKGKDNLHLDGKHKKYFINVS